MQVTDELIRGVVQQVLTQVRNGKAAPSPTATARPPAPAASSRT